MATEYTIPKRSKPMNTLPRFRCSACGMRQLTDPKTSLVRCLYCGREHHLRDGRWVRS